MASLAEVKHSSMDSTFPVLLPEDPALFLSHPEFDNFVHTLLEPASDASVMGNEKAMVDMDIKDSVSDDVNVLSDDVKEASKKTVSMPHEAYSVGQGLSTEVSPFLDALRKTDVTPPENKMYTENKGVAYRSTKSALLDLFSELEVTISGPRLRELLEAAWVEDPLATLKTVWNGRSIHLGKADKVTFYRCLGWMKDSHPKTVITSLSWIFRSTIEKKVKTEDEDAPVIVSDVGVSDAGESNDNEYDVKHGVSHGYWKDLLNLLVLAVNNGLDVLGDPRSILNKKNDQQRKLKKPNVEAMHGRKRRKRNSQQITKSSPNAKSEEKPRQQRLEENAEYTMKQKQEAKEKKHHEEASRYANAIKMLENPFYHALHLTVARLFAEQLIKDRDLLRLGKRKDLNKISLAAKWAPSLEGFHDKHTFIVSTIAELLYPRDAVGEVADDRETYLRRARESYRRLTLSPLRKALEVVERDVTAGDFKNINYAKVPSLAMDNYKDIFARNDLDRFEKYIDRVAEGKSRISGAVLMPATLVKQARSSTSTSRPLSDKNPGKQLLEMKMAQIASKTLDSQWASLVKRIKDNGTISSSIAVCDVSGSMTSPVFPDKTCPIDTAIGLSLLLAEITEPPFGSSFVTFSADPVFISVGGLADTRSFAEKVQYISNSNWSMNTDFTAVFERLILPRAIANNVKQEDMVKQVFVFSDMQFDRSEINYYQGYSASGGQVPEKWDTAFQRIKQKFAESGYEMPKLIFWNLAGGRAGYPGEEEGDPVAPKPVTKETEGTMLVGGYSQGMMKMFLESGGFEAEAEKDEGYVDVDVDEEMVGVEVEAAGGDANKGKEEGEGLVEVKMIPEEKKTKKIDPMDGVWKAICHRAYDMLRVVD